MPDAERATGPSVPSRIQKEENMRQVKLAITFLGLLFVFGASESRQLSNNYLKVKHPLIFKSLSAVSIQSSTDVTSEWTEATSPTVNWEPSSVTSDVDISSSTTNYQPSSTATTNGANICENETSADYIFPNPDDCTTFYLCSNGYPYLYDCPSGLVYNDAINQCDYPYNVSAPPCNINSSKY